MGRGLLLVFLTLMTSSVLVLIGDANAETQDLSPCEGDDLTLSCDCPGDDSNSSWTFVSTGNVSMSNDSDAVDLVTCANCTSCNYTLENVTGADNGMYNCLINGTVRTNSYSVTVVTPPADDPVCTSSISTTNGTTIVTTNSVDVIYVRQGDNVTLGCSIESGPSSSSLGWSYLENGTSTSIVDVTIGMSPLLTSFVVEGGGEIELAKRFYTCEASVNNTCGWDIRSCLVGPVYVITEENFYISRGNDSIYVGDNVTLECVTNVNGTSTRWMNGTGVDEPLVLVDVSVDDNSTVIVCELFATSEPDNTLDTRMTTIVVEISDTTPLPPTSSQPASTEATETGTTTPDSNGTIMTVLPTKGTPLNIAAIAGGAAAGGAVVLILLIILIVCCCRSKRKSDVSGDSVVHRPKKKTAKPASKKHRSAILSLRHKLPLFSTPYDDSDDDEEKVSHKATVNADVDTIIMEYRPKSKIASQIRVDLEADDGDEGTIENGFAPTNLGAVNDEDESPYSMGVVEGRYGIIGPRTFAAANTDSEKLNENKNNDDDNDDAGEDVTDPYSKVFKANNPGDNSFDNMMYGPIAGVDDKTKASMYDDGESSPAKPTESNESDIAGDVDTRNSHVDNDDDDVTKVVSEDTDIAKEKTDTNRESTTYAEIPPPIAMD